MKSKYKQTPFKMDNVHGVIVHNRLIADGPVDPETGKPLINPETGKPFPGLNDDLAREFSKYVAKIKENKEIDGRPVSRFGIFTQMARRTPIWLYDHPDMIKLCKTAFTDGNGVYVNANFFRKCWEAEKKYSTLSNPKVAVLFLLIHELFHKLRFHNVRMKDLPHGIANRAQDRYINANIKSAFASDLPLVPMMYEMMEGGSDAATEKWRDTSEEIIGRQMANEYEQRYNEIVEKHKKKKKKNKQNSASAGGGGAGGGGSSDDFNPDPDDGEDGMSSDEYDEELQKELNDLFDEFNGDPEDRHHITPEEMIELFSEAGLDNVARVLEYPNKGDKEGLEKMLKDMDHSIDSAIQKASIERNSMDNPSAYPGGHVIDEISSRVKELKKNKINWKMDFMDTIVGEAQKEKITDDMTTPVFYVEFDDPSLDEIYDPAMTPQESEDIIVVLFDSSGSTKQADMREVLCSEMLGLVDSAQGNENAKEVLFITGDTTLRGKPIFINRNNIDLIRTEGVGFSGDGGTDIARCVDELEACQEFKQKGKNIKHLIVVTDCEDNTPQKATFEKYLEKGMTITFMSTRNPYSEKWNREVDFAKVVFVEDGAEASLSFRERAIAMAEKQKGIFKM